MPNLSSLNAAVGSQTQSTQLLTATIDSLSRLFHPVVTEPPSDVLTALKDPSLAGISKRLGPTAPAGMVLPEVWERPQVQSIDKGWQGGKAYMGWYSQGLEVTAPEGSPRFDYGSTDLNGLMKADVDLVLSPDETPNAGVGVFRVRTEEHSNGLVSESPVQGWNDQSFPDRDAIGHVKHNMHDKLGSPVAIARGKINRTDAGFVLYGTDRGGVGFVGGVGTATAYPAWGHALPAGKTPLSLALSSQNEFLLVGVHDETTGKGQVGIYWLWAGQDQQAAQNNGKTFPYDFPVAHPGLMNSGVVSGIKLFGYFDLPVKYPTSLDCVNFSGAGTRIQGPDGNASYLNIWKLGTADERASFLAQNGTWVSNWGKVAVASKPENKVVLLDLSALIAGVRDQYFGSQAKYDQTAYQVPGSAWGSYTLNNPLVFPWGIEAKPAWAPVITKVLDVASPADLLLSERGGERVAVATSDGYVRFYKFDGGASDGEVRVGDNPVRLRHNKIDARVNGGLVVTCRASRSVVILSKFGLGSAITFTIQDSRLIDPVDAEAGDTHGLSFPYITVADFNGKAIRNYRIGVMTLNTQGGATFGMGPDGNLPIESGGSFAVPGHPFAISGSNVN